jgi:hypothetical protein
MKPRHIAANIVVAIAISVVLWGIPDDFAWLVRFILVSTIFGFIGLLIYIGVRFRERPSE